MLPTPSAEPRSRQTSLADRYRVLLDIARTLTGTLGLDDLFRRIYRETSSVLEAGGFYISLFDADRDLATVVFFADRGEERHVEVTYRGSESDVIRTGRASIFEEGVDSLLVLGDEESELTRSAVSAAMRYKGRVIGVISAQSYRAGVYEADDIQMLQGIADIAAVAIENARKVAELERRRREAERIEEIGRAVVSSLEPRKVLHKVVDAAMELLAADGATVWFLEEGDAERRIRVEASGGEIRLEEGLSWALDDQIHEKFVTGDSTIVIEDVAESAYVPDAMRAHLESGSGLAVPLRVDHEVAGVLTVGSRQKRVFSDEDRSVLEQLAGQASVALQNARLHASVQALSLTDPLTDLPNRRHLTIHLEREVAAALRGRSLAVVMFDLDNFKQYNDTMGHQAGDEILRLFGEILYAEARSMNLIARYGGDEFVSVISDTPYDGVRTHAERVAHRVQTHPKLAPHEISVSYGIAFYTSGMNGSADLIRAADEHLYETKNGRPSSR